MSPPAADRTRRRLLAGLAVALGGVGLAGCSGSPDPPATAATDATDTSAPATAATDAGATATATPTPDTASSPAGDAVTVTPTDEADLDLREANVVDAEADGADGAVGFDVTLYHDDDGEDGYANWWQVETLDGDRLGRRELFHAHSTAPFTRSETVTVPDGTTYVVVRGHDQTHGYGGQAMVVNLRTGERQAVRQGPEPRAFADFEPSV